MELNLSGEYFVTKTFSPNKGYSCCFRNWRASSHCHLMHGYDLIFQVTFACEGDALTHEGWVVDFGGMGHLKKRIEQHFDHTLLVAEDDPMKELILELHRAKIANVIEMPRVGCEAFSEWLAVEATDQLDLMGRLGKARVRTATVFENGANASGINIAVRK